MKRVLPHLLGIVLAVGVIGVGISLLRPDLMPDWAKLRNGDEEPGEHSADSGLFCDEHGVPERFCTLCHPSLAETLLLCEEHGDIPEDICTLCHPEVEEQHKIVTCEHDLPSAFCPKCAGEPLSSNMSDDGWCTLHDQPEESCPECEGGWPKGASQTDASCRKPLPIVRFASNDIARTIGVETEMVSEERHAAFAVGKR